jgi:hypothetical protein
MGLCSKPLPVLVDAFLRTEAFEGVAMPHHAELAVAVSAKVVHAFSRQLSRIAAAIRDNATQHALLQCTISISTEYFEILPKYLIKLAYYAPARRRTLFWRYARAWMGLARPLIRPP